MLTNFLKASEGKEVQLKEYKEARGRTNQQNKLLWGVLQEEDTLG
jgi:hypothetical protein